MEQASILQFKAPKPSLPEPTELKYFRRITSGLNVEPLRKQILENPQLWNLHRGRTEEESPHHGVADQWLRYRAPEELTNGRSFIEPHFPVWYPAWRALTAAHPIVYGLMSMVRCVHLGGVLLTKIPPGGSVKPHHDRGSWHSEFHNLKMYVAVQSNPGCRNYCEDESINMKTGECFSFNNLVTHSVDNGGLTDRLTLIICCRVEL